jgi:hypothetical protein
VVAPSLQEREPGATPERDSGFQEAGLGADAATVAAPAAIPECANPTRLASSGELLAIIEQLVWQPVSIAEASLLEISDDFVATSELQLAAEELPVPDTACGLVDAGGCTSSFRGSPFPRQGEGALPMGVRCLREGPDVADGIATCIEVSIATGTTFRLRATIEDLHPELPHAFVELERACDAPCEPDELRCVESETCLPRDEHCAFCEGRQRAECACRESDRLASDGEQCSWASSPDYIAEGVCLDGVCR